jgi:hypothetical protein
MSDEVKKIPTTHTTTDVHPVPPPYRGRLAALLQMLHETCLDVAQLTDRLNYELYGAWVTRPQEPQPSDEPSGLFAELVQQIGACQAIISDAQDVLQRVVADVETVKY